MCKECEKREQLLTLQREVIETLKRQLGIWGEYNHWELYRIAKENGLNPHRPPQDSIQLMKSLRTIEDNKEDYDCKPQHNHL